MIGNLTFAIIHTLDVNLYDRAGCGTCDAQNVKSIARPLELTLPNQERSVVVMYHYGH